MHDAVDATVGQDRAVKDRYRHGLWNRHFLSTLNTRLAMPWTRIFVALRLTPNQVSLLSLGISLVGMALVALAGDTVQAGLGGSLLLVGLWWDHSDGQVARLTGKGSPGGALLDTLIDRWVEAGWLLALGLGILLSATPQAHAYPAWVIAAAVAGAIYANLYLRWANIQKDLYLLRHQLLTAPRAKDGTILLPMGTAPTGPVDVRMFWIPFAFNRDVTLWMLFAITWTPYWLEGLLLFTALHAARGLEKNWYTFQSMRRQDEPVVANFLHADYHK